MKKKFFKFQRRVKKAKAANEGNITDKEFIFENILFRTSLILFFILIAIQVILVIPDVREKFNLADKTIGVPLSNDEYLYNQGQITLKLISEVPDPTVKILINGEEVAMFEKFEMPLTVKDGDVIEIDGSQSLTGQIVKVQSISSNISSRCKNAVAKVEKNIQGLLKVEIN